MANEIKFGNKVVLLNGNPLLLPNGSSDPVSGNSAGDLFYRSDINKVRIFNGSTWNTLAYIHADLNNLSADDHVQYALLAGRSGGQTLTAGTGSGDNLILRSTTNGTKGQVYFDETTASSSTSTGAVRIGGGLGVGGSIFSGVSVNAATSVLSPLFERASSGTLAVGAGNTTQLDLGVNAATATGNFLTGSGNKQVNIGTGSGTNTINIGGASSTININGTLQYIQTTNLQVSDPTITLNEGAGAASANGAGIEINENSVITAYMEVGNSRSSWDFLAPASSGLVRLTPNSSAFVGELKMDLITADRTYHFPDASGTVALTSNLSAYLPLAGGTMTGNILMSNQNAVRYGDTGSNYVGLRGPTAVTSNYTLTFPALAPGSGQQLQSDNTGQFSWVTASSGTVNSGTAGNLTLYATSSTAVSDTYVQNTKNINVSIASQPTRSQPIVYTIPNPGDAVTAASFVLTEGAQTVNGVKTFGSNILASSNNSITVANDAAELSAIWTYALQHNDAVTPTLNIGTTGNNGNVVVTANGTGNIQLISSKLRLSTDGTNFFEDQYYDSLTLAANTSSATEVSSSLSFAVANFRGAIVNYIIEESTTNNTRVGQFIVTSDGTVASSSDQFSETASLGSAAGLQLSADVNSGNVRILFNNTSAANSCAMRAQRRIFRA